MMKIMTINHHYKKPRGRPPKNKQHDDDDDDDEGKDEDDNKEEESITSSSPLAVKGAMTHLWQQSRTKKRKSLLKSKYPRRLRK